MTLIAFSTSKDRADIVADTWAYNHGGRRIAKETKIHPIAHLDMAYAGQGSCEFQHLWSRAAQSVAMHAATFDDFADVADPYLQEAWDALTPRPLDQSAIFLIGYSHKASRFRAYQFASEDDFERRDLEAPFIIPAPFAIRPSEMELARIKGSFAAGLGDQAELLALMDAWDQKPALVAPSTVKGWVQLGKQARASRALVTSDTGMKVFVAGDLHHAVLQRGEFRISRVHQFNDTGPELAQLVAGTLHPISQNGPCSSCDSGRPYIDCCLPSDTPETCHCGSGKPFVACCSVRASAQSPEPEQPCRA